MIPHQIPIFDLIAFVGQDAVLNLRIKKIIITKTIPAISSPGVPSSSPIPVGGKAVVVGGRAVMLGCRGVGEA